MFVQGPGWFKFPSHSYDESPSSPFQYMMLLYTLTSITTSVETFYARRYVSYTVSVLNLIYIDGGVTNDVRKWSQVSLETKGETGHRE